MDKRIDVRGTMVVRVSSTVSSVRVESQRLEKAMEGR